jgi:regulator of replication initiation timing
VEIMNNRLNYLQEKVMKRQKLAGEPHGKEYELIDENTELKSENKKLKAIVKSLKGKSKWVSSKNEN